MSGGDGVKEGLIVAVGDAPKAKGVDIFTGKGSSLFGFADGGYADPVPGGHPVRTAEAGHREWVLPDPLLKAGVRHSAGAGGGSVTYNLTVNHYGTGELIPDAVVRALRQLDRTSV